MLKTFIFLQKYYIHRFMSSENPFAYPLSNPIPADALVRLLLRPVGPRSTALLRQGLVLPEAVQPQAQLRRAQVSAAVSPG
jgi:hypothetical protein